jgi:hypothetical protein
MKLVMAILSLMLVAGCSVPPSEQTTITTTTTCPIGTTLGSDGMCH